MNDLARSILERSVEDYTGLWELLSLDELPPHAHSAQAPAELIAGVRDLLERGWVALFLGNLFDGDQQEITSNPDKILSDVNSWRPPDKDKAHIRLAATSSGEDAYYSSR
jgi:hypothetical protein